MLLLSSGQPSHRQSERFVRELQAGFCPLPSSSAAKLEAVAITRINTIISIEFRMEAFLSLQQNKQAPVPVRNSFGCDLFARLNMDVSLRKWHLDSLFLEFFMDGPVQLMGCPPLQSGRSIQHNNSNSRAESPNRGNRTRGAGAGTTVSI